MMPPRKAPCTAGTAGTAGTARGEQGGRVGPGHNRRSTACACVPAQAAGSAVRVGRMWQGDHSESATRGAASISTQPGVCSGSSNTTRRRGRVEAARCMVTVQCGSAARMQRGGEQACRMGRAARLRAGKRTRQQPSMPFRLLSENSQACAGTREAPLQAHTMHRCTRQPNAGHLPPTSHSLLPLATPPPTWKLPCTPATSPSTHAGCCFVHASTPAFSS